MTREMRHGSGNGGRGPRTPRGGRSRVVRDGPRLKALNEPRPADVRVDRVGVPVAVRLERRVQRVEVVRETWRIDDEWWRRPIARRYWALVLEGGALLTVYRELEETGEERAGRWFVQG